MFLYIDWDMLDLISVQTSFLFWSFCGCIPDENEEEQRSP